MRGLAWEVETVTAFVRRAERIPQEFSSCECFMCRYRLPRVRWSPEQWRRQSICLRSGLGEFEGERLIETGALRKAVRTARTLRTS